MADAKGMAATLRPRLSAFVGNVYHRPDNRSRYNLSAEHLDACLNELE